MATVTAQPEQPQSEPRSKGNRLTWGRIAKQLVPIFAVITALVAAIPLMLLANTGESIGRGLQVVGQAYAGLMEGSLGLAINDRFTPDDLPLTLQLADALPTEVGEAGTLARRMGDLQEIGVENILALGALVEQLGDLEPEAIEALAGSVADIQQVGAETLQAMQPLITDLNDASRGDVRRLAEGYRAIPDELTADARAEIEALAPAAADYPDNELMAYLQIVNDVGIVALAGSLESLVQLEALGIDPASDDADQLAQLAEIGTRSIERAVPVAQAVQEAGITDLATLEAELRQLDELIEADLLASDQDMVTAINEGIPAASSENLLVRRPGNRVYIAPSSGATGITYNDQNTEDPADDKPDTIWVRLGGGAFLFFPHALEGMIVRSIPFVIAGLAVALGFKAGLFNIGAEGQLYMGAIVAVFIGYSTIFAGLPGIVHLPLVVVLGIMGGLLWGTIPGALKAYTGAHEVITTIMLNFIAVRFADWLINTPGLMRDPNASIPQTPHIVDSAVLPRFDLPAWMFLVAGAVYVAAVLYLRRDELNRQAMTVAIVGGVLVALGGMFLGWITVRGNLHIGLLLMFAAVWFTDWFLNRTTLGFELRTVGANANAARYAGMSVPRNIVLAMALSGALAGLAGTIEISGVQFAMHPNFFSGVGFDAIAVALLARTNPRNMIWAGLLWGGLYAGAPLMQSRAQISIDLVRIIQALIIMFIAADTIIRYLWRVPDATPEEKAQQMFSTSWGS